MGFSTSFVININNYYRGDMIRKGAMIGKRKCLFLQFIITS